MENNDTLKRILLNMNYDSKKTLSENVEKIMLNEAYKIKVITKGGNNSSWWDSNKNLSFDKYTLRKSYKNFVLVDAKIGGFNMTLKYDCSNQSITVQESPNNQFTGAILEISSLEQELEIKYCRGKGDDMVADNMFWKRGDDLSGYWVILYNTLKNTGFPFKLLDNNKKETTDPKTATQMWFKNFIINRNLGKYAFITVGSPATVYANLLSKYKGESDLSKVILKIGKGFEDSDTMTLKRFLEKDWKTTPKKDEKVIDYTKNKKTSDYTPGGGGTGNVGVGTSTGWNTTCKGTYSMGCKTTEVGQAQQCLKDAGLYPYIVDNKFGKRTMEAVKTKIGKTSFTDADLQTICKTKQGSGGEDLSDFDKDMSGSQTEKPKEDITWTGDVY